MAHDGKVGHERATAFLYSDWLYQSEVAGKWGQWVSFLQGPIFPSRSPHRSHTITEHWQQIISTFPRNFLKNRSRSRKRGRLVRYRSVHFILTFYTQRVVKGESRSRFTENKTVLGISRFTEKKRMFLFKQKLHTVTFWKITLKQNLPSCCHFPSLAFCVKLKGNRVPHQHSLQNTVAF